MAKQAKIELLQQVSGKGLSKSKRRAKASSLTVALGARYYTLPFIEKIEAAREGVSKQQLTTLKDEIAIDYGQLADLLAISRASLMSKKKTQRFNKEASERILQINDIVEYGYEVFGDHDNFNEWLKSPSEAFGNVTPLSMLDTFYGIEEVKKEIGRIAYGVY